ncbi:hypothetical protein [Paraburkholderia sp. J12]|uniref:hypothetical protein n=1 Tax=Paraburkholderia sp. J12 TaxID=2805432 RepID=UPI002ABE1B3C|nr:hypothetical protein [Paraburkholderia sp. J12]
MKADIAAANPAITFSLDTLAEYTVHKFNGAQLRFVREGVNTLVHCTHHEANAASHNITRRNLPVNKSGIGKFPILNRSQPES